MGGEKTLNNHEIVIFSTDTIIEKFGVSKLQNIFFQMLQKAFLFHINSIF